MNTMILKRVGLVEGKEGKEQEKEEEKEEEKEKAVSMMTQLRTDFMKRKVLLGAEIKQNKTYKKKRPTVLQVNIVPDKLFWQNYSFLTNLSWQHTIIFFLDNYYIFSWQQFLFLFPVNYYCFLATIKYCFLPTLVSWQLFIFFPDNCSQL